MTNERRWQGIVRPYTQEEVERLRPSVQVQHTLATLGAERLWELMQGEGYVQSLGALTGNQAVQQVQAGLKAIYVSGWQVAADANGASHMYPDQSLYPANSVPTLVRAINNALLRADQVCRLEGRHGTHWLAPIVADAEAGFGGMLNAFEIMKALIEAGAAAVHFEDQLSSAKKCGHLGGKVLVPSALEPVSRPATRATPGPRRCRRRARRPWRRPAPRTGRRRPAAKDRGRSAAPAPCASAGRSRWSRCRAA